MMRGVGWLGGWLVGWVGGWEIQAVNMARSARWLAVVAVCIAMLGTDALPLNEQLEGGSLTGRRLLQDETPAAETEAPASAETEVAPEGQLLVLRPPQGNC